MKANAAKRYRVIKAFFVYAKDEYEAFVEQREEKMRKHMIPIIKEWRNIK